MSRPETTRRNLLTGIILGLVAGLALAVAFQGSAASEPAGSLPPIFKVGAKVSVYHGFNNRCFAVQVLHGSWVLLKPINCQTGQEEKQQAAWVYVPTADDRYWRGR